MNARNILLMPVPRPHSTTPYTARAEPTRNQVWAAGLTTDSLVAGKERSSNIIAMCICGTAITYPVNTYRHRVLIPSVSSSFPVLSLLLYMLYNRCALNFSRVGGSLCCVRVRRRSRRIRPLCESSGGSAVIIDFFADIFLLLPTEGTWCIRETGVS